MSAMPCCRHGIEALISRTVSNEEINLARFISSARKAATGRSPLALIVHAALAEPGCLYLYLEEALPVVNNQIVAGTCPERDAHGETSFKISSQHNAFAAVTILILIHGRLRR